MHLESDLWFSSVDNVWCSFIGQKQMTESFKSVKSWRGCARLAYMNLLTVNRKCLPWDLSLLPITDGGHFVPPLFPLSFSSLFSHLQLCKVVAPSHHSFSFSDNQCCIDNKCTVIWTDRTYITAVFVFVPLPVLYFNFNV